MSNNPLVSILPFIDNEELIRDIIENEIIEIYFQPIISFRTNSIYGFEALTRCTYKNNKISPFLLFKLAKEYNLLIELDKLTRLKSIKKFKNYYFKNKNLKLFLNFESSLINNFREKEDRKYDFINLINDLDIPHTSFIIEIKEDKIEDTLSLKSFCETFKNLGFLIALDDFGTGNSTFDRLNIVHPDLIKIDKSLFFNIENNDINEQIVSAITKMSSNLGIKVLAEGVEKEESILKSLKFGINLYQGFYFFKPSFKVTQDDSRIISSKILETGRRFKVKTIDSINKKRKKINNYIEISEKIIQKFSDIEQTEIFIQRTVNKYDFIEACYLIDSLSSKQLGETITKSIANYEVKASIDGEEHYLKEYYYITNESQDGIFLSKKYISRASGNLCKTFARKFLTKKNKSYIICFDIILKKRVKNEKYIK